MANDSYFLGAPRSGASPSRSSPDPAVAGQALADGDIDWQPDLPASVFDAIREDPDLSFVEYHEPSFLGLYFNLHPESGTLFVDRNLRQAVAYCFDKPTTAPTATDGGGAAIYSEIPPESWAYPSTGLNEYPVDPARAKSLIEASGWTLGEDGIYAKDDRRLSTVVAVRAGYPQRTRWLELVAEQVRDVRHRATGRRGPVRLDRPDARRLPARQRRRPRGRAGRSMPTLAGSTRPPSRTRSGCTTRASARRPSDRPRSTTSATRIPRWIA